MVMIHMHGYQMAIARFLDSMCLALWASRLWLRYAMLRNLIPSFPWIAPPRPPMWRNPRKGRDQILPSGNLVCRSEVGVCACAQHDGGRGACDTMGDWTKLSKVARRQNLISSFPLDCARVEGVEAQSKERRGSNFAA